MKQEHTHTGLYVGLATYAFWGFAPIYFKYLEHIPALAIVAHRVVWAALLLAVFLVVRDGRQLLEKLRLPIKQLAALMLSGVLVATNWVIFVWAVSNDQILATSLGYFINPLVSVLLGLIFLGEKLRGLQLLAVAIAVSVTLYLALFIGEPPWIALSLAFSFGFYGLVRKRLAVGPMIGLMWETILLLPAALVYLVWFMPEVSLGLKADSTLLLLIGSGLVTLLPLIGFNYAAKRMTLAAIGFLQYLAPSISFLLAIFVYAEPFDLQRFIAFCGIWLALVIYTVGSLRNSRKRRETTPGEIAGQRSVTP